MARRFNQQSKLGSYLDPIADKVLLGCVVGALGFQVSFIHSCYSGGPSGMDEMIRDRDCFAVLHYVCVREQYTNDVGIASGGIAAEDVVRFAF